MGRMEKSMHEHFFDKMTKRGVDFLFSTLHHDRKLFVVSFLKMTNTLHISMHTT